MVPQQVDEGIAMHVTVAGFQGTHTRDNWLVFADDWGRHPSSCQYLIAELLNQVDVTWVNTIGMRTPGLDWATLGRVVGKLRASLHSSHAAERTDGGSTASESSGVGPRVLNPAMWPWFTRAHDRQLNQWLLCRALRGQLQDWCQPRIAVTTIPIVADLVGELPMEHWVYYCVDDFSVWPGLDQRTILRMERELIDKVDQIVAVSDVLKQRIEKLGRSASLLTHGVNLSCWDLDNVEAFVWPAPIKGPVALFWGVVDRRLDTEFVLELDRQLRCGSIVFIGPQQSVDPRILACRHVHCLPPVASEALPAMAAAANCLIMPYADSPVTRAMQPLKFKEYLATGKPVVARRLPATEAWSEACDLVASASEFAVVTARYFSSDSVAPSHLDRRQFLLANESWSIKAKQFSQLIGEAVSSR
jgi:glycosyltransferase involved in cell wall biosynthesis